SLFRRRLHAAHVSCAGWNLFGSARIVRAVGGRKVVDRSALYAASRQFLAGSPGLGRPDLQRDGSPGQLDSPLLDAAATGNPEIEGTRYCRLLHPTVRRTRPARSLPGMDSQLHPAVRAASPSVVLESTP